jgi:4-hydroxybenzoyl-CoA thioesterase
MARITIELPEHFPFTTELQIYQGHINEAQHLDNAQLLGLVSEARQRFFTALGLTQTRVQDAVGIVIADAAVQYLSEAFYGETLVFDMRARDFSRYGCDLVYRVRDKASGREVARAKTGIVFFDYATRKVAPIPEVFRERTADAHTN